MSLSRYRAWDKENDRMIYPSTEGVCFEMTDDGIDVLDVTDYPDGHVFPRIDSVLMQSTDIKDKNGVEIFDGDVLQGEQYLTTSIPTHIKGVVRYSDRHTMFYLDDGSGRHDLYMRSLGNNIYNFEIIGNIYENPELLEAFE